MEQYLNESDNMKVEIEELEFSAWFRRLRGRYEIFWDESEEENGTQDLSHLRLARSERFLGCQHVAMGQNIGRKAAKGGRIRGALGDVRKTRIMP